MIWFENRENTKFSVPYSHHFWHFVCGLLVPLSMSFLTLFWFLNLSVQDSLPYNVIKRLANITSLGPLLYDIIIGFKRMLSLRRRWEKASIIPCLPHTWICVRPSGTSSLWRHRETWKFPSPDPIWFHQGIQKNSEFVVLYRRKWEKGGVIPYTHPITGFAYVCQGCRHQGIQKNCESGSLPLKRRQGI